MSFAEFFSRQAGHPSGWFGRWVMSRIFDKGNAELNQMMKDSLQVQKSDRILELGPGTGKMISEISLGLDGGCIEGIEISETMATMARKRNAKAIAGGRVVIHSGNFDTFSFQDNTYDAICTCNTIYFWPDPLFTLRKARALLKAAGKMIIAFEDDTSLEKKPISTDVFKIYSQKDVEELLKKSGFDGKIEIRENSDKRSGLCCVVAYK